MLRIMVGCIAAMAILVSAATVDARSESDSLQGTWCVGEDGLILTFAGKDSLIVSSRSDESVQGSGTYARTDSTFTAKVVNEDLGMEMKYLYRWKDRSTVEARALFFVVNGDSVDHPVEWIAMTRCNEQKPQPRNTNPTAPPSREKQTETKRDVKGAGATR